MAIEPLRDLLTSFLTNLPIDDDVVQSCIDVNFVGHLEGGETLDFTDVEDLWESIIEELVKVVLLHNGEDVILQIENGELSLKNVIAVLGFAMEKISDKTVQSSIVALLAARMYMLLCCLTSSHVFGIYHQSLFNRTIASYRNVYTLRQLRGDTTAAKPKKKAAGKNKTNAAATTTFFASATANAFPDETEEVSPQLLKTMTKTLLHSLDQLFIYLQQDNIGTNNKVFSSIVDLIRCICRFDYSSSTKTSSVENYGQFKKLDKFSDRCFALAHVAMDQKHNHEDMVLSMFCLPRLTFKSFEAKFMKGSLPQSTKDMAEVMMTFIKEKYDLGIMDYCIETDGKITYNDDRLGTDTEIRDLIYVKRLAENVCHHSLAERKDYRESSIRNAINLVKCLPPKLIQQFFYFAVNYGYIKNQRSRLIAVDLVSSLLESFDVSSFPSGVPVLKDVDYEFGAIAEAVEYDDKLFHQNNPTFKKNWENFLFFSGEETFEPKDAMLQLLIRSTMDKLSAVRIRGLCAILPYIKTQEGYEEITKQTKEFLAVSRTQVIKILSEVNEHDENLAKETPLSSQATQGTATQGNRPVTPVPTHIHQAAQVEAQFLTNISVAPFADLMLQRCNDKVSSARKHAVPIVEALLTVESNVAYQKALLRKLQDFCRDPFVTVRKDGAQAMTNIVRDEEVFKQAWLHTVLPMVNDREETVEKSCRKYFFDKIVDPIIRDDGSDSLSWNLMIEIATTTEYMRAFRRCFQQTAREKEYHQKLSRLANVLYGAVKVNTVASSAWMLLNFLADAIEIDPTTAVLAWMNSDETSKEVEPSVRIVTNPTELVSILSILLKRRHVFTDEQRDGIRDNIASRFVFLRLPESVISEAIITFVGIVSVGAVPGDVQNMHEFFADLIQKFYNELLEMPEDEYDLTIEERKIRICRRLLTMGQASLHSPKSVTPAMVKLVIHILSVEAPSLDENTTKILSRPVTRTGVPSQEQPPEVSRLQGLPFDEITGDISAAAVIAMGKFMLSNEDLARDYLEKLAVVHGTSIHASVRNNVIYVLADCYLRYTSKMDTIQPAFLHGLRDRVDFVRYHSLMLTTELLRSQYMKMSPLVLARLLPLLLDSESAIRNALTGETLAVIVDQFPTVYIDNFITCMFLFNRVGFGTYTNLERYEMPENPILFLNHDLSGALKRKQRMELYKFMLKKFDDHKRFVLITQISKTIFGNIVEGKISFDVPEVKQLILDGFQIIESREARLTLDEGQQDPEEDDGEVAPENIQQLARATIRATFCSAFVTFIMPKLMAMAKFLIQRKSPLQKEFRNCLAVIAEAYPDQLHVLFRDSVQLKIEVEAELRRRKKDARKSRLAKNKVLVNDIERAAVDQAQIDAEKENSPPNMPDFSDPAIKVEPNATQAIKSEPMEVEHPPIEPLNQTIDITMEAEATAIEKTLVAENEEKEIKEEVMKVSNPLLLNTSPRNESNIIINGNESAEAEPIREEPPIEEEEAVMEIRTSEPPTEEEEAVMEIRNSEHPIEEEEVVMEVRNSPMQMTPQRRQPSKIIEETVPATPETPKQPSPKRPRLSMNRLQAIRDEEVAQNFALLRSPSTEARVPKLSSRVGLNQKQPVAASSSSSNQILPRAHSSPNTTVFNMNFTFDANISAIPCSPKSSQNVTFRRRKTSDKRK